MLKLIERCPEFVGGYRDYCREFYDNNVKYFYPTNPNRIDDTWFERIYDWYKRKESGLVKGQPVSFHYWAVDGDEFIGEFQLRPELTEQVMAIFGSVGYSVRVSKQGRGYGTEILRQGFDVARSRGLDRLIFTINETNAVSAHICEKLGGVLMDKINSYNENEGEHTVRRYWIYL